LRDWRASPGLCLEHRGRIAPGHRACRRRAQRCAPARGDAHRARRGVLPAGAFTVAIASTRERIAADPSYAAGAQHASAGVHAASGGRGCPEAFERALRLDPANAEVLNNYGWFLCLRSDNVRGMELINRA
jgi:type IV pilus assembly protein PilF